MNQVKAVDLIVEVDKCWFNYKEHLKAYMRMEEAVLPRWANYEGRFYEIADRKLKYYLKKKRDSACLCEMAAGKVDRGVLALRYGELSETDRHLTESEFQDMATSLSGQAGRVLPYWTEGQLDYDLAERNYEDVPMALENAGVA